MTKFRCGGSGAWALSKVVALGLAVCGCAQAQFSYQIRKYRYTICRL
jgi:hypothetical protein